MPSLLLGLYTTETILRIPVSHQFTMQLRPGATKLLEALLEHQKAGRLDVALLAPEDDFFAPRLLSPLLSDRFKDFSLVSSVNGPAGGAILERHWKKRAMELDSRSTLRIMVAGTRQGLVGVWRADEMVVVKPFMAMSKQERQRQRAELKEIGLKKMPEDLSMFNLGCLVEDALNVPDTPISDVLKTSPWCVPETFRLLGESSSLASD